MARAHNRNICCIRNQNPSKRAAVDPQFRPRGHKDRHCPINSLVCIHTEQSPASTQIRLEMILVIHTLLTTHPSSRKKACDAPYCFETQAKFSVRRSSTCVDMQSYLHRIGPTLIPLFHNAKRLSASSCLCVCPHGSIWLPLEGFSRNLRLVLFFPPKKNLYRKLFKFYLHIQ
jgi:hypothetical protein